jgi:hypothetical protein
MVDLTELEQETRFVEGENGASFVQIPIHLWLEIMSDLEKDLPQNERLRRWMERWQKIPDDKSPEWWDEFEQSLRENRIKVRESDNE